MIYKEFFYLKDLCALRTTTIDEIDFKEGFLCIQTTGGGSVSISVKHPNYDEYKKQIMEYIESRS